MTTLNYATPFQRLIARIIDKVVITAPIYIWFGFQDNQTTVETIGGFVLLITIIILNLRWDGQTVGKRLMKIRIRSKNGEQLHFVHYLLREFSFNLFPIYLITNQIVQTVWMFWMITSIVLIIKFRRGIHDFLAQTVVVKDGVTEITEVKSEAGQ